MSFSVISLPPPLTALQQVKNGIDANTETVEMPSTQLLNTVILDVDGNLGHRSALISWGSLYFPALNTNQVTLTQNIPTLISASNNVLDALSKNFTLSSNGILTYTGNKSNVLAHIYCNVSMSTTTNNTLFEISIYKNGVIVAGSPQRNTFTTSNQIYNMVSNATTKLNQNDTISFRATNLTNNSSLTPQYMNLSISVPYI